MLEQLFGSKTRAKILRFFLTETDLPCCVREISKILDIHINSVRKELDNLERLGLIVKVKANELSDLIIDIDKKEARKNKYYKLNKDFVLYPELKSLFAKARLLLEKSLVKKIQGLGHIYLVILTGFFTGVDIAQTDILIVGRVNRRRLSGLVKRFEKELGREIYYTVMSKEEFRNRRDLTDRFVFNILENRKIVLVNRFKLS